MIDTFTRRRALVLIGASAIAPRMLASNPFPFYSYADPVELASFTTEILYPEMASRFGINWRDASDFQQFVWLRQWAKSWLSNGYWERTPGESGFLISTGYKTLRQILDWHAIPKADGFCDYYSQFFFYVCRAAGLVCRRVWWDSGVVASDQAAEVWIPSLKKWVMVSVLLNCWFSGPSGSPLGGWEMSELYHAGRTGEMHIERDGMLTLPAADHPSTVSAVFSLATDVCFFRTNGERMLEDGVRIYRYAAASQWPYPTMANKERYVISRTFSPLDLYRDPGSCTF